MMNRFGLDRFKKATSVEPFSVTQKVASIPLQPSHRSLIQVPAVTSSSISDTAAGASAGLAPPPVSTTAFGAGQSTWQPPDWAVDPKSSSYWLDVMKEGEVVDKITLDKKRLIFGRQHIMCDLVLDHLSVSRQHAVLVHHKNGGIYIIDMGSVHGTFVANERLTKDNPTELEVGESLRFGASTRIYVLRKSVPTSVIPPPPPSDIVLPPPPDASDEEAVLAYNTSLNRLGIPSPNTQVSLQKRPGSSLLSMAAKESEQMAEGPRKKARKAHVSFRDDYGGILAEVVGVSDGADVSTEPGPVGVREGSLVGKYESLVQVTVIPKGQGDIGRKSENSVSQGVTQRLKQYLDKVKSPGKGGGLYGDIYGETLGGSWATVQTSTDHVTLEEEGMTGSGQVSRKEESSNGLVLRMPTVMQDLQKDEANKNKYDANFNDDDLFGEDDT